MCKITLFTSSDASLSQAFSSFFQENEVSPTIINIDTDQHGHDELLRQTGKTIVPTTIVGHNGYRNYVYGMDLHLTKQLISLEK